MANLTKKDKALLATIIVAMGVEATPYHMATLAEVDKLKKAGLVDTNDEIKDGDKIAVRATEAGVAANTANAADAPTTRAPAPSYAVNTGRFNLSALPAKKSRTAMTYPFDTMNAGDDFFIEATEARPNPAKSMASTVSAANKKYADKPEGEKRTFQMFPVDANGELGGVKFEKAGAVVIRTA